MHNPRDVHFSCTIIDGHADTPQRFADEGWHFGDERGSGHLNLVDAQHGGLSAQIFAAWPEPHEWRGRYASRTLQLIESVHEQVRKHPDTMRLGLTADDIERAHADHIFCALISIEGGHAIENDLDLLRHYYALGARSMTLTWANSNEWADSSGDLDDPTVAHRGGLTDFGRDVVREMNRLGMIVDISHVSDATFWDTLRTTHAPIIASHSSARALTASPRNLTDEQLQALATNNGLVMVNFYPAFIDESWRTAWSATAQERAPLYEAAARPFRDRGEPVPYGVPLRVDREFYASHFAAHHRLPEIDALIDHLDHVARIAGIDHVGLGSDFDGFALAPRGMESVACLPAITEHLMARGYTAEQMRKLLGGNFLRVLREVEAEAAKE